MRNLLTFFTLSLFPLWMMAQMTFTGIVTSEANFPIVGASVKIPTLQTGDFTNSQGAFTIRNVSEGTFQVEISARGYAAIKQTFSFTQGNDREVQIVLKKVAVSEEVLITGLRANPSTATAYSTLDVEGIKEQNFGQDFPFLLNRLPSTVVTSDAGAGIGYTGIRIRGSDPTRINVTLNGIPLNDSESHGVFWVNLPDFASSTQNVQVQRGVGTSTNGSGAFGGSINVQTQGSNDLPYVSLTNGAGSFNTFRHTLSAGTGRIGKGFSADVRLSRINSDGWVDRGFSDLQSFFTSASYYGEKSFVKANVFSGQEQTFQSWYGIPEARFRNDAEGLVAHYNRNVGGLYVNEADSINLFDSDERYNYYLYDNQTDNYTQTHYQLLMGHSFSENLTLSGGLHYTKGQGFFEEFRRGEDVLDYGTIFGQDTSASTDLIRRRWLDNDFYGVIYSLNYVKYNNSTINRYAKLDLTLGGAANIYDGDHFGEVIWAQRAFDSDIRDDYYFNRSRKTDANIYLKALLRPTTKLSAYLDLQFRTIGYRLADSTLNAPGTDNDGQAIDEDLNFNFFNPKVGITYNFDAKSQAYFSLSVANREPVRSDIIDAPEGQDTRPEQLYDFELGYRFGGKTLQFEANAYYMYYIDQLVLTGALNDVGANVRQNVDRSYRTGIELVVDWQITDWLAWRPNLTLSQNKILSFDQLIYNYVPFEIEVNTLENTDIAFSPSVIAGSELAATPIDGLEIALLSKYVGQQFLDNTSNESRSIDAFMVHDLRINYDLPIEGVKGIRLGLLVNNLWDTRYAVNGYTYSFRTGGPLITENYYYPQAGRNFLASLIIDL
ncbi:MAG: TonB-dependent receptor [Bacteroidota bacterium]